MIIEDKISAAVLLTLLLFASVPMVFLCVLIWRAAQ